MLATPEMQVFCAVSLPLANGGALCYDIARWIGRKAADVPGAAPHREEKQMNVKTITRAAILIALLVALQYATASMGQFVTGSCVNLVLAVAALFAGLWSGVAVALLSPFFAFLLGVGPKLIQIVPFIALGNVVYVLVLALLGKRFGKLPQILVAVVAAAVCKFATLFLVIVRVVLPMLGLPEKQVQTMSVMFSWPQLVTALIGGCLALVVVPALKKAFKE